MEETTLSVIVISRSMGNHLFLRTDSFRLFSVYIQFHSRNPRICIVKSIHRFISFSIVSVYIQIHSAYSQYTYYSSFCVFGKCAQKFTLWNETIFFAAFNGTLLQEMELRVNYMSLKATS